MIYSQQAPWIDLIYGGMTSMIPEEKKEVVSMARQHVGTSQSGMKAGKRARAACPHARVTHRYKTEPSSIPL
jgi:hypothetical protein